MRHHPFVAAVLAATLVLATPRGARAGDDGEAPSIVTMGLPVSTVKPLGLDLVGTLKGPGADGALALSLFAPTPADIRMSRGAKTALIVTAIVVGALVIIGGAVVLTRPGHHL